MSGSFFKRVNYFLLSFILVFTSSNLPADDTEIYFSSASTSASARSNVLFILDTSGSMGFTLSGDPLGRSRMEVMKGALSTILTDAADLNIGLARFNDDDGASIIYPISYIEDPVGDTTFTNVITDGDDDAEEDLNTGTVSLNDPLLETSQTFPSPITKQVSASSDDADEIGGFANTLAPLIFLDNAGTTTFEGMRFTGLDIPPGATINTATLELTTADATAGGVADLTGELVANSNTFVDGVNDVSSRVVTTPTTTTVTWNPAGGISDTLVTSPDISSIIQEIVDDPGVGWSAGNALSIIMHNTDLVSRTFYSFDGDSTKAPQLTVDFTHALAVTDNLIALRFTNVNIPQNSIITNAVINLTSDADDSGIANWTITAETPDAVDGSSNVFTGAANELSSRIKTATSVDWSVPDMTQFGIYSSPDIKTVIQEVVSNADWCGGNDLTIFIKQKGGAASFVRHITSTDGVPASAPKLQITIDPSSPGGCYGGTETAQVIASRDDAEEDPSGSDKGSMTRFSTDLDFGNEIIGMRFQEIDVPQGATIIDAFIDVTASSTKTAGNPTLTIFGEKNTNPGQFSSSDFNITNRTKTTASVDWTTGDWTGQVKYTTSDLKTIVQEIVNQGGWASGNSMVFIVNNGANQREAYSFNGGATKAPFLRITFEDTGTGIKTVRDTVIELVNDLPTGGTTPIVEALYEAAHYWRGQSTVFGKTRSNNTTTRLSHVDTYTGGTVFYPAGCTEDNLSAAACTSQAITGSPIYTSPFSSTLTCQSNYQVLLTDGDATNNGIAATIKSEYLGGVNCDTLKSDGTSIDAFESCGIDLVEFMALNDQSSTLANDQLVKTYTIGFDVAGLAGATQYLKDMAAVGAGTFFEATTSDALVSAFSAIVADVRSDPTSFVAPALATNSFNRLLSRDEAYFGLFTPFLNVRWPGNVKKYNACIDSSEGCTLGEILDGTGVSAVDTDNKFKTTAQDIWSTIGVDAGTVDGRETTLGGVGGEMDDFTDRIIYTDTTSTGSAPTSGTPLSNAGFNLTSSNWDAAALAPVRTLVCPTPDTTAGSECETYMKWMLGSNSIDTNTSDSGVNTRWTVNDVLHSSPQIITYGGADLLDETVDPAVAGTDGVIDTFFDKIIYGTNDGGLRLINSATGKEEWSFMPAEVLNMQRTLIANGEADHIYGFDVTPTLRIVDVDSDGFIEPADGDIVHVYAPMRRGGTNIYALDLTATVASTSGTVVPKFLWRIEGGTNTTMGNYTRLDQTWSEIKLATIKTGGNTIDDGGTNTKVLIFGGGYDAALDSGFGTAATAGSNNNGNAIYIVNPGTGELIFWISGSGSGADIEVPNMQYSIPTTITVADSDGDGDDDRLFFGDTGGQVWRVDLANDIDKASKPEGSTIIGRLASISTPGTASAERRFFEPPSYVQVVDTLYSDAAGGEYDYVLLGTGNRAHPLETAVSDRFYAFRDLNISTMPDTDSNNRADNGYPSGPAVAGDPIRNSDLIDVTTQVLDEDDTTHDAALGWFFDFDASGTNDEKVLSGARTIAGAVLFTTYEPEGGSTDPCSANVGGGNAYNFNILNTRAFLDWDTDGTLEDFADRKLTLGGGIPSDVVPIFTKEGVVGIVGVEGGAAQLGLLSGVPRVRTYWYQEL